MRIMFIAAVIAALAVFCMASKCTVGDRNLPQKAPTQSQQTQ